MIGKDPLQSAPGHQLFEHLGRLSAGFSANDVAVAAANLLINAVRQNRATRAGAQVLFDEITTKARQVLLQEHYDSQGNRRNIFPFHQTIEVSPIINNSKLKGT